MSAKKFTDQFVKSAPAGDYSAANCQGLYLRVTPNEVRTFRMVYRSKITGKVVPLTLGRYPDLSLAIVQEWVDKARARNANSQPVGEFTAVKKNEPSVAEMLAKYNDLKLTQKRTGRAIHTALTSFTVGNKWSDLPFSSLTKKQIMAALEEKALSAPRYATNVQQMMGTWLKWGARNDHLPANPIAGMEPVGGEQEPRERTLSFAEIRKLWAACQDPHKHGLRTVYADVLLTMLTTGCRPGMACGLVEGELFGFGGLPAAWKRGAGAVADFPKARMKMGIPFAMPLNSLALEIIERRRALATDGVLFPTPSKEFKDKGKPVRVRRLSAITMELSKTLGFKEAFTPHDLRRTASNLLCREFDANTEVNAFLAHETVTGVMKHYNPQNRWNGLDRKRELADRLAEMLIEIVGTQPGVTSGAEVIEIRRVA
jgi:integrase